MADIVLRDRNGAPVEYPGIERVKLNTVAGETVEFVDPSLIPESVEKTVELDFSGGAMTVTPETGKAFSKVNIPVPEGLSPENIPEGMTIAGIAGAMAAGGSKNNVLIKKITGLYEGMTVGEYVLVTADELSTINFDTSKKLFVAAVQASPGWGYIDGNGSLMYSFATSHKAGGNYYGIALSNYLSGSTVKYNYKYITANPFSGSIVYNTPYYKNGEIRYYNTKSYLLLASQSGGPNYTSSVYIIVGNIEDTVDATGAVMAT